MAPFLKIVAPALLLSTVEDAEPELTDVKEGVAMTVLFKGVLDELAVAAPGVVCEEVMDDAVLPPLAVVVVAGPVVLTDKDVVLEESIPSPSIVPTE